MQTSFRLLVLTAPHLEEILKEEVEEVLDHAGLLGEEGRNISLGKGCISFEGTWEEVVILNLKLRTATRVLVALGEGRVKNLDDIYQHALKIPWEELFLVDKTFAVSSSVHGANKLVSQDLMVNLKIKDAIADRFRSKFGRRPNVDRKTPDMRVFAKLTSDYLEISLDTSGEALSHRGYRMQSHAAPMREILAAALIRLSGWNKVIQFIFEEKAGSEDVVTFDRVKIKADGTGHEMRRLPAEIPLVPLFLDPMCGSGTVPIEAALVLKGVFPGAKRPAYPFLDILTAKKWRQGENTIHDIFDYWKTSLIKGESRLKDIRAKLIPYLDRCLVHTESNIQHFILGRDLSRESIRSARQNAEAAGVSELIHWQEENFFLSDERRNGCPFEKGILVMNPPYGKRLDDERDEERMIDFYRGIGDTFKRHYSGWITWVFSGNEAAIKRIGLRATRRYDFLNGQVKCRYHQFIIV